MATTTKSKRGKAVSKDLSDVLDHMSGQISKSRQKEARTLLADQRIARAYVKCT